MTRAQYQFRAALAGVLIMGACSDPLGPSDPIIELPRALTVQEIKVIDGANSFGFDLMREVVARDERPNIVLSPFSASMALGMTLNGADGGTFDAMRSTLGYAGLAQEEINDSYGGLSELLTGLDPEVRFDVANSIWTNADVPFRDSFINAITDAFGARSESRDFGDPETTAAINQWVDESTNGFIDKIVEVLDPSLAMLLINAIYFDAPWTTRFDPDETRPQGFTRADRSTVEVSMMSLSDVELPLGRGLGYAAVELPYGGTAFSMVVVVPNGDARDFVSSLNAEEWDAVLSSLRTTVVDLVSIPRFGLSYDGILNEALKDLGMSVAFGPGADFRRMSPLGDQFCIDFVRQKTFIEVNERGTRAAAATAVGVRPVSFNGLVADRPFLFAIRERLTGTILFVGMVGDPTAAAVEPDPVAGGCR
jgi:serine protease inhibitor